jgi:glycerophosphoryl diester phosphodiesterase
MTVPAKAVRVAHAYGNSRQLIEEALAGPCDVIEADTWLRSGRVHVRHERRVGAFPLLYDSLGHGHPVGPYALRFGGHFVRPDIRPLALDELLDRVAGKRGLLLDIKGRYDGDDARRFAGVIAKCIADRGAEGWVSVCGQTYSVLDALRESRPPFALFYSMERREQLEAFQRRRSGDPGVNAVCAHHHLLSANELSGMVAEGVRIYCWTVDDRSTAVRLIEAGACGIISNDLSLLASLG